MKSIIAVLVLGISLPAFACMDRDYKYIANAQEVLAVYDQYSGFAACVDKLERKGVNVKDVTLHIKERAQNDDGPTIKWFRIQGQDSTGAQTRLEIEQKFVPGSRGTRFKCGAPTYRIPRGC